MPRRLTPLEVSMLASDTVRTPGHVGMVDIFDPGTEGFDYERLIALIRDRIEFVPHYRQRVRPVPARLAAPVWVDDENFDLTFHVRRSALPRPGTLDQLREFVGRVLARRLDPSRPLWEIYLVEGMEDGSFALVSKTHLALVDGIDGVDLGQVLLDADRRPPVTSTTAWEPLPEPGSLDLVGGHCGKAPRIRARRSRTSRAPLPAPWASQWRSGRRWAGSEVLLASWPERRSGASVRRPIRLWPATCPSSVGWPCCVPLARLKAIRQEQNHTVNDVVLAVVTGGLRAWLLTRGESISSSSTLTSLVPMSVTEDDGEPTSLGSQVAPHLQSLPIGNRTR